MINHHIMYCVHNSYIDWLFISELIVSSNCFGNSDRFWEAEIWWKNISISISFVFIFKVQYIRIYYSVANLTYCGALLYKNWITVHRIIKQKKCDLQIKCFRFVWHFVENMVKDIQNDNSSHYVLCSAVLHWLII